MNTIAKASPVRPLSRALTAVSSSLVAAAASLLLSTGAAAAAPAPVTAPDVNPTPPAPVAPAVPTAPAAAPAAPASATPCAVTAKACMSLSQRKAWLTDGAGHITYGPTSALGGRSGHQTPTGTFHVQWKDDYLVSNLYDAPMPDSTFFASGIAFHAGDTSQRSHGCIHLSSGAAKAFFDRLQTGDEVQVVS